MRLSIVKMAGILVALMVMPSCDFEVSGGGASSQGGTKVKNQGETAGDDEKDSSRLAALGCEKASAKPKGPVSKKDIASGCMESSGEHIDLDSHEGLICVGKGSMFEVSFTADSVDDVHIAICDSDGKLIEDALMMWHKPEIEAEAEQGGVSFKKLFLTGGLPDDAKLHVAGITQDSTTDEDYITFDIATLLPSGVGFSNGAATIMESYPVQYKWELVYWPRLELGDEVDWYILAAANEDGEREVSEVMQTEVTSERYRILGDDTNPSLSLRALQPHDDDQDGDDLLRELPDCYRLVTKISREGESNSSGVVEVEEIVAVGGHIGCWNQTRE